MKKFKDIDNGHILTVSGVIINLYDLKPKDISINDIAHGLANICRWGGHTKKYWSVAQHCCMMFNLAPKGEELKYLFHDAEEAYWGDIISPLKNILREQNSEIIELMEKTRRFIYDKFNIEYVDKGVKEADRKLKEWEYRNIVKSRRAEFWSPARAKREWTDRYYKIKKIN